MNEGRGGPISIAVFNVYTEMFIILEYSSIKIIIIRGGR